MAKRKDRNKKTTTPNQQAAILRLLGIPLLGAGVGYESQKQSYIQGAKDFGNQGDVYEDGRINLRNIDPKLSRKAAILAASKGIPIGMAAGMLLNAINDPTQFTDDIKTIWSKPVNVGKKGRNKSRSR